ncbi:PH domain-containing protein [Pirellulaceae bacterium SH467]
MSSPEETSPAQRFAKAAPAYDPSKDIEEKLWSGGYSPRAMIGSWIGCLIASAILIAAAIFLPSVMEQVDRRILWGVALVSIVALWSFAALTYLYRRFSVRYELTSQRLIHKHGLLVRTTDRIELIDIDDVAYTQGIVERMLNVGAIKILSTDLSHASLRMIGIEDVSRVAGLIDDARRKERRKRALHIETT